jgi:tyrosyl-tRNA synthetase
MLNKDAVSARLYSESGVSFTEFSYQLLQAMDFLELCRRYGCTLQTGGSDHWGNIIAGVDLVHRAERQVRLADGPTIVDLLVVSGLANSQGCRASHGP